MNFTTKSKLMVNISSLRKIHHVWIIGQLTGTNYFAAMSDCGYTRWIGECAENGKTMWRVKYFYPNTMIYDQINEEDFDLIEL